MRGYFDANRQGVLFQGAHDFQHIHRFFADAKLTMVGLEPADALVGNDPLRFKCARDRTTIVVYLANPTGVNPETDNTGTDTPSVTIDVPAGKWRVRWFHPSNGRWSEGSPLDGAASRKLTAPHEDRSTATDYVLLLMRDR